MTEYEYLDKRLQLLRIIDRVVLVGFYLLAAACVAYVGRVIVTGRLF